MLRLKTFMRFHIITRSPEPDAFYYDKRSLLTVEAKSYKLAAEKLYKSSTERNIRQLDVYQYYEHDIFWDKITIEDDLDNDQTEFMNYLFWNHDKICTIDCFYKNAC